jgi:hypothetical protein
MYNELLEKLEQRFKENGNPVFVTYEEFVNNMVPQVHDDVKEVLMFQNGGQNIQGVMLKEKCNLVIVGKVNIGRLDKTVVQQEGKYLSFNLSPQYRS